MPYMLNKVDDRATGVVSLLWFEAWLDWLGESGRLGRSLTRPVFGENASGADEEP